MIFKTREDIAAPIDYVYARVTDFSGFERSALRRGIDVRRTDQNPVATEGSVWRIAFAFRGKQRKAEAKLTACERPNGLLIDFQSGGIKGRSVIELVPLSIERTRLSVAVELSPTSLGARLMIQSLRLARGNMEKRFKSRVADFAEELEEAYRSRV